MNYNAIAEVVTIPFVVTIYLFLLTRYKNRTNKERSFRRTVLFVMLSNILDIIVAVVTPDKSV